MTAAIRGAVFITILKMPVDRRHVMPPILQPKFPLGALEGLRLLTQFDALTSVWLVLLLNSSWPLWVETIGENRGALRGDH